MAGDDFSVETEHLKASSKILGEQSSAVKSGYGGVWSGMRNAQQSGWVGRAAEVLGRRLDAWEKFTDQSVDHLDGFSQAMNSCHRGYVGYEESVVEGLESIRSKRHSE